MCILFFVFVRFLPLLLLHHHLLLVLCPASYSIPLCARFIPFSGPCVRLISCIHTSYITPTCPSSHFSSPSCSSHFSLVSLLHSILAYGSDGHVWYGMVWHYSCLSFMVIISSGDGMGLLMSTFVFLAQQLHFLICHASVLGVAVALRCITPIGLAHVPKAMSYDSSSILEKAQLMLFLIPSPASLALPSGHSLTTVDSTVKSRLSRNSEHRISPIPSERVGMEEYFSQFVEYCLSGPYQWSGLGERFFRSVAIQAQDSERRS